jgi:membrane fusion protein (multidrug efflux system)
VLVDNADGAIRPGMIARVYLLRRVIPDALTVPLRSILDKGGERIVFVVEDGVARARTIKAGVLSRDKAQIIQGLKPGDQLIVAGQTMVEDGIKVKLK